MINLEKYSFKKYSENYHKLFLREKCRIKRYLPKSVIEHIGSTAVPGLGGKGIIDVLITVPKREINKTLRLLIRQDYDYRASGGDNERKFLQRIIRYAGKERRIHIQLTHNSSYTAKSVLAVRDYLIKHPDQLKKYAWIKKEAVRYAKGEGKKYREYKDSFLKRIEKAAFKENKV